MRCTKDFFFNSESCIEELRHHLERNSKACSAQKLSLVIVTSSRIAWADRIYGCSTVKLPALSSCKQKLHCVHLIAFGNAILSLVGCLVFVYESGPRFFFFFRLSPAVTIAGSHANVQSVRKCPATTSLHFSPNSNLPTGANGCSWNTITANTQNVCVKCALKKHPGWILNNANLLLDVSSYLPYTHTPLVTNTWLGMYLYTWCSHKLSRRTCRLQIGFWRKQRKEAEFPMWLQ